MSVGIDVGIKVGMRAGVRAGHVGDAPAVILPWTMTKTNPANDWNSGASSQLISGACSLEFIAPYTTAGGITSPFVEFGLSESDPDQAFASVKHGILLQGGLFWQSHTLGVAGLAFGYYAPGDVFTLTRSAGGDITIAKTGEAPLGNAPGWSGSTAPLLIDNSLLHAQVAITGIKLFSGAAQVPITWANVVGVAVTQP